MKQLTTITDIEILHGHLFCGLGGGAKGFNKGQARVGNLRAKFRCVGGIDSDAAAIADFDRASGAKGTMRDLFSRQQFEAFHGCAPPADWREATTADMHNAFGGERPNIIFLSAPCKGFSGLLAETKSLTAKYQALNALTLRGVWLSLEAYKDDPVELYVFENVPRIAKRGRALLDKIVKLFQAYGYIVAETTHDCGVLGGLGQSRKRFLLVARHREKVPNFLYEPEKKTLKGVGEIIDRFPVPGPDLILPMHRMPALQWQTWVRLALVEAGSDWRSLNKLKVEGGVLADYGIAPEYGFNSTLGVGHWHEPANTVKGRSGPTCGTHSVADPRAPDDADRGAYGVGGWERHRDTITSARSPGQGRHSVADPRIDGDRSGPLGVTPWQGKPANAIAGESFPTNGPFAVQDPRVANGHPKSVQLGVRRMSDTSAVVKGDVSVGTGPYTIADPRPERPVFNNIFRIVPFNGTAPAVSGPGGAGGLSVADPRYENWHAGASSSKMRVNEWRGRAANTVTGSQQVGSGAGSVADPRPGERTDYKQTKYRVTRGDEPAGAVIGASTTGNGAFAVQDPRPDCLKQNGDQYQSGGHYGVVPWPRHANAVAGSALHDNGFNSVADPREYGENVVPFVLPKPKDRLVCCIRALDGTWHRPFTTLELAALQSLVDPEEMLILEGLSDSAWRERIGNAVPPEAAAAIASVMGQTLLGAWSGHTFMLSNTPIWVRNVAIGLSVHQLEELAA